MIIMKIVMMIMTMVVDGIDVDHDGEMMVLLLLVALRMMMRMMKKKICVVSIFARNVGYYCKKKND